MRRQERLITLLFDGYASHTTPRFIACAGSQKIIVIKLVAHLSRISWLLDLCLVGDVKMLYKRNSKQGK
jgi:hypothetical protein